MTADPDLVDSIRKLTKALGVASDNAVRKALTTGRLKKCVRQVDGKTRYHVPTAVAEWRHNTDPRQQRAVPEALNVVAPPPGDGKVVRLVPKPTASEPPRRRFEADAAGEAKPARTEPADGEDEESMADIVKATARVNLERAQFDLGVAKGDLASKTLVIALVQTLGRHFRDGMLRLADKYGPQIAGELKVDPWECHQVLDKYLRHLFETHIASIDPVAIVFPSSDGGEDE